MTLLDHLSDVREGLGSRFRLPIERADDRRLHDRQVDVLVGWRQDWCRWSATIAGHRRQPGGAKVTCGSGWPAPFHWLLDVLAEPQLHAVPLELELGQVVLAHHLQNQLDLV